MPTVEYTKKRSLASGSVDENEVLEFDAKEANPMDMIDRDEMMTMGKRVSSVLKNILGGWRVTVITDYSDLALWREFFHSTANREQFLFDPTGTEASPGTQYNVTLSSSRFNYSRTKPDYMTVSFELEETS